LTRPAELKPEKWRTSAGKKRGDYSFLVPERPRQNAAIPSDPITRVAGRGDCVGVDCGAAGAVVGFAVVMAGAGVAVVV